MLTKIGIPLAFWSSGIPIVFLRSIAMVRLRHNVKSLRYPYAVTAFWTPIVACGGEVTEIDYLDSLVFFILQVCS